jgi:hypothetical protein
MTNDEKLNKVVVLCSYCGRVMEVTKLDSITVKAKCAPCNERLETYYYTIERVKTTVNLMKE